MEVCWREAACDTSNACQQPASHVASDGEGPSGISISNSPLRTSDNLNLLSGILDIKFVGMPVLPKNGGNFEKVVADNVNFENVDVIHDSQKFKEVAARAGATAGFAKDAPHLSRKRTIHGKDDRRHICRCTSDSKLTELSSKSSISDISQDITLTPGTGVLYTPRRSITSKGYGNVCSIEALSLLADVSCKLSSTHQRSCNFCPRRSESTVYKENFTQPRSRKLISKTLENTYKIVKKLRTPGRTPRKSQLNCVDKYSSILEMDNTKECDEIFFYDAENGTNLSLSQLPRDQFSKGHLHQRMTGAPVTKLPYKDRVSEVASRSCSQKDTTTAIPAANHYFQPMLFVTRGTQATLARALSQPALSAINVVRSGKDERNGRRGREKRADRYARKVLQFVGNASISEKRIREALGNNPDTSKALRLLITERKLTRFGDGGKGKAYVYVATAKGLLELQRLEDAGEVARSTPDSESASSCNPTTGRIFLPNFSESGCPFIGIEEGSPKSEV